MGFFLTVMMTIVAIWALWHPASGEDTDMEMKETCTHYGVTKTLRNSYSCYDNLSIKPTSNYSYCLEQGCTIRDGVCEKLAKSKKTDGKCTSTGWFCCRSKENEPSEVELCRLGDHQFVLFRRNTCYERLYAKSFLKEHSCKHESNCLLEKGECKELGWGAKLNLNCFSRSWICCRSKENAPTELSCVWNGRSIPIFSPQMCENIHKLRYGALDTCQLGCGEQQGICKAFGLKRNERHGGCVEPSWYCCKK